MKKKFVITIIIILSLIAFLALMDILGVSFLKEITCCGGNWWEINSEKYLIQFWSFATMLGIITAGIYYLFRKDLSETFAILGSYAIMIMVGLEDILFYLFQGIPIDRYLPWLDKNPIIFGIAKILGYSSVTNIALLVSVGFGAVVSYLLIKKMERI